MGGNNSSQESLGSDLYDSEPDMEVDVNACNKRLVNWVTELLLADIRKIVSSSRQEKKGITRLLSSNIPSFFRRCGTGEPTRDA